MINLLFFWLIQPGPLSLFAESRLGQIRQRVVTPGGTANCLIFGFLEGQFRPAVFLHAAPQSGA